MNIGYYTHLLEQWKDCDENSWVKETVCPRGGPGIECGTLYLKSCCGIGRVWNAIFRSEKEKYENTATISHFLEVLQCDEQGNRILNRSVVSETTFESLQERAIAGKPLSLRRVRATLEEKKHRLQTYEHNLNPPTLLASFLQRQADNITIIHSVFPKDKVGARSALEVLVKNRNRIGVRAENVMINVRELETILKDEQKSDWEKEEIQQQLMVFFWMREFENKMGAILLYFKSAEKQGFTIDQAIEGLYNESLNAPVDAEILQKELYLNSNDLQEVV